MKVHLILLSVKHGSLCSPYSVLSRPHFFLSLIVLLKEGSVPSTFLQCGIFFPLEWILDSLILRIHRAQITSSPSQHRDGTMHSLAIKLCESLSVLTVTTNWHPSSLVTICWSFCIPQVHQLLHFFLLLRCW